MTGYASLTLGKCYVTTGRYGGRVLATCLPLPVPRRGAPAVPPPVQALPPDAAARLAPYGLTTLAAVRAVSFRQRDAGRHASFWREAFDHRWYCCVCGAEYRTAGGARIHVDQRGHQDVLLRLDLLTPKPEE